MTRKEIDLYLEKLYYSRDLPSSYASKNTLYQPAREKFPKYKLNQVENWLSKQLTDTLHKSVYKTFQTRPVIVDATGELWQLDILDLSTLARENDGHNLIFSIIDLLSKYGWL